MTKRTRLASIVLFLLLSYTIMIFNPVVLVQPGKAFDTREFIAPPDHFSPTTTGKWLILTLSYQNESWPSAIWATIRGHGQLYVKRALMQGQSPQQFKAQQVGLMRNAERSAIAAARAAAHNPHANVSLAPHRANVGGPSAGLMLALQMYDDMTVGDFTHGHVVAGTGAISADGAVEAVGGVAFKVAVADRAGAQILVVPVANQDEARRAVRALSSPMQVVGVATLAEAIHFFNRLAP